MSKLAGSQNLLGISLRALSGLFQAFLGSGLGQNSIRVAMVSVKGMALPIDDKEKNFVSPPLLSQYFVKLY